MTLDWGKYGIDVSKIRTQGKTLCPKCSSDRKHSKDLCLSVNKEDGIFNCHNCGFNGTAKVYEQVKEKKVYKKPEVRPRAVGANLSSWFQSRGISNDTLLKAKVTEASEFMPQEGKEMNCVCFNYYRDGELVNIKFRDGKKNFKLVSGAELIFYNLDAIKGRSEAIITEGEVDCLSLMEIGLTNSVSVPNGASKGNQKLIYLDNCIDAFEGVNKIIIATDSDEAGLSLQAELVRRLGADRCYIAKYPQNCKDSNEVLLKHGKDVLFACISNAKQCDLEGIITVQSIADKVENIALYGYPEVLRLDFIGLNELIKWKGGEWTVITGIPSHGKSDFLDQIAIKLATRHKWRFGVFSPETQPAEIHVIRLMEKTTGKNIKDTPIEDRKKTLDFLNDNFYFLSITENDLSIDGILTKGAELVKRYGINAMIIDPWNYISHTRAMGQDKGDYISEALTKITLFCAKFNVHVFLIAHPTKIKKDLTTKKHEIPTLYDISDSAHFYNKTFNGICVYRNFDTGLVDIHVQKVKFKWVGKTGTQSFTYDIPSGRYAEEGDKPMSEMHFLNQAGEDQFLAQNKKLQQEFRGERLTPDKPDKDELWDLADELDAIK